MEDSIRPDRSARGGGGGALRRRLRVTGVVQGVGFRPFVWRLARRHGLVGWVGNDSSGVAIEVAGPADRVAAFERALRSEAPPRARVEGVEAETLSAAAPRGETAEGFAILDSHRQAGAVTSVPADSGPCAACLAEIGDPSDRRHRHPFATCTDCGPRFTIIRSLPYDRATTTLARFPLCGHCAREYADPGDRRFHAEPICCPNCGPVVWYSPAAEARPRRPEPDAKPTVAVGDAALAAARRALRGGAVLAIKGVGGFHLACDATNAAAVAALRAAKRRPSKPLAVLAASVEACATFADPSPADRRLLESPERPIVLLPKRGTGAALAAAVAPGVDQIGVMLPGFPLHSLLVEADGDGMPPLAMTSGNISGAPIEHDNAAAISHLGEAVTGFLLHDREIHVPCDDSVVRTVAGHVLPLRRSRGFAPLPIPLADGGPDLLAVGADLKAALCVARGSHAWLSQHVGDLDHPEVLATLGRHARHMIELFSIRPEAVVADLHPGSLAAHLGLRLAADLGVPLLRVQHHRAHAAALLADRFATGGGAGERPTLVAALDGTGFLADPAGATIAGSEFFECAGHVAAGRQGMAVGEREGHDGLFPRARLVPFLLPGGEAAIHHPWRTALALLHAAGVPWDEALPPVRAAGVAGGIVRRQLDRRVACPPTTSLGRLFDGISALLGVRLSIDHEGEAAAALEALAAEPHARPRDYAFPIGARGDGILEIDWRGVVVSVVADVSAGRPGRDIALGFHAAVAGMIAAVADAIATRRGEGGLAVGLTGGVFQNGLLVERAWRALEEAGHEPFCHRLVPPNDGGIALGQVVLARMTLGGASGGLG